MKTTLKLFLALSLFCAVAIADDGNQGTGGYTGDCSEPNCPPVQCMEGCGTGGGNAQQAGGEGGFSFEVFEDVLADTLVENPTIFSIY